MNNKLERWGYFGGSFDPPHYGHLRVAVEVKEHFSLQRVYFVPTSQNPLKKEGPFAEYKDRVAMVRLALRGFQGAFVGRWEEKKKVAYTVDTFSHLTVHYPKIEWYLLVGVDTFLNLPRWKSPSYLLSLVHLVVFSRERDPHLKILLPVLRRIQKESSERMEILLKEREIQVFFPSWKIRRKVIPFRTTRLEISSTALRKLLLEGKSVQYLLPTSVERYIRERNLYG